MSAAMPQAKKGEPDDTSRSVLNPLDVMVITRERLQDTLDDAVRRGRMTRDDADRSAGRDPPPRDLRAHRRVIKEVDG